MIINNVLNYIFTAPSSLAVLRVLNQSVIGLSGREIARLAGITHRTALKTLDNLEALKILDKQIVGNTYYFTIKKERYLYKEIISLVFKKEKQFKQKLWDQIRLIGDENIVSLIVFGSVARKVETYESDLDLCIVYDNKKNEIEKRINELSNLLYTEYGVTLAPFYVSKKTFKKKANNSEEPINNILKEGIVIYGEQLNRVKLG